jgi:glycosyltransferase involved in cell wall biosynthesis
MRRHFVEREDFEVMVATSGRFEQPTIRHFPITRPARLQRLSNTRLCRLVRNYEMLARARGIPRGLLEAAREFRPDCVFTVADLTLSEAARRLAQVLGVPLVSNFQDWWPRGQFYYPHERPYPWARDVLERRFRRLHRESALVFCTSEGMQEFLGPHPNSHVLYPIPARGAPAEDPPPRNQDAGKPFRILYTGTAFGSYGRLLLELAGLLRGRPDIELRIYGAKPDWPAEALRQAEAEGLYRGFLPFEQLELEMAEADAFLAVMSFEKEMEAMMRTSFTTKFLDYAAKGRPILVWGPDYCSPVRLAKRENAAVTITCPDAASVLAAIDELRSDTVRQAELSQAALQLARTVFDPTQIHEVLRSGLQGLKGCSDGAG